MNYTKSQSLAIDINTNANMLISAGAGSGKTTIMIARIVELIRNNHLPVSSFLVVTFTKKSAADMKNKLIKKLDENLTGDKDAKLNEFLLEQIENVATSDVSNLHSFCARLLKTYFYEVGLDPAFVVLDEDEMNILKNKALEKLFAEGVENKDILMFELADILSKKRTAEGLSKAIIKMREFLMSQTDGDKWFEDIINNCYNTNLNENKCADYLNKRLVKDFESAKALFEDYYKLASNYNDKKFAEFLQKMIEYYSQIDARLSPEQNYRILFSLENAPKLPGKVDTELLELKEEVKGVKADFQKTIDKYLLLWGTGNLNILKQDIETNKTRIIAIKRLADRYGEILQELKNTKGGLDFLDLERDTIKVLLNPEILQTLKNKYKYIFVDEYQDINPVQEHIISLLSNINNRFMVGDIKQSIYRFRLCDPEIFLNKYHSYKDSDVTSKVIDLKENFRSHINILEFCNFVFKKCYTTNFGGLDYKENGMLLFGGEKPWDNPNNYPAVTFNFLETSGLKAQLASDEENEKLPVYSVLKHEETEKEEGNIARAEARVIAKNINELIGTKIYGGKDNVEKVLDYKDMVILLATRGDYLPEFVSTLTQLGVPVTSDYSQDIFEDEHILALCNFLKIIDNFAQDYPLASVMNSELFNFSLNELAHIKLAGGETKFFYEAVTNVYNNKNIESSLLSKLNNFYELLVKYKKLSGFLCVKDLVSKIINELEINNIILLNKDASVKQQRLARFLDSLTSDSLSAYLKDLENTRITYEPTTAYNAVRIMTIHSSKGLEFPVVFLANCGKNFSTESSKEDLQISKDFGVGIKYYDKDFRYKRESFIRAAINANESFKNKEEQLRLFYVALTRAVNHLIIVGSGELNKLNKWGKASRANSFLDWLAPCLNDYLFNKNALNNIAKINILDALKLSKSEDEVKLNNVEFVQPNNNLVTELKQSIFEKPKFKEMSNFAFKSSVTALNKEDEMSAVLFNETESGMLAELGTVYHKVLSNIDFRNVTKAKIEEVINNLVKIGQITLNFAQQINVSIVFSIANSSEIQEHINGKFLKEQEFIMSYCVGGKPKEDDFMIVQGICDLAIIDNNEIILIDYKLSNKNAQQLKAAYSTQINLYATALKNAFNLPVAKKYICKLTTAEFILVND